LRSWFSSSKLLFFCDKCLRSMVNFCTRSSADLPMSEPQLQSGPSGLDTGPMNVKVLRRFRLRFVPKFDKNSLWKVVQDLPTHQLFLQIPAVQWPFSCLRLGFHGGLGCAKGQQLFLKQHSFSIALVHINPYHPYSSGRSI
jgi:hypothetical protein